MKRNGFFDRFLTNLVIAAIFSLLWVLYFLGHLINMNHWVFVITLTFISAAVVTAFAR